MNDHPRIAIDARNIVKQFGSDTNAVLALDNVSLEVRENEFFTLLGTIWLWQNNPAQINRRL